ncbi:hypothetical protein [Collinsella phocaeensis]|uniref:hypothetical protein n=1 Tax=Collinsella phocaeensis TaxID=1871016 RepID=UPI00093026B9|nr:hypothetical protein [Collinsella phocaeensis]
MSNIMSPAEERLERSFRHVRTWSVLLCLAAIACLLVAGVLAAVVGAVFIEEERQATVSLIAISVGAGVGGLAVTVVSALSMGGKLPLMLSAALSIVLSAVSLALAALVAVRGLEGVFGLTVSCGTLGVMALAALVLAIVLILANGTKKRLLASGAMPYEGYGSEQREDAYDADPDAAYGAVESGSYGDAYESPEPYRPSSYAQGPSAYGAAQVERATPVADSAYGEPAYAPAPSTPVSAVPSAPAPAVDAAATRMWTPSEAPASQPAPAAASFGDEPEAAADPFAFNPDYSAPGALGSFDAFDLDDGDEEWAPVVARNRRQADDEDDWAF